MTRMQAGKERRNQNKKRIAYAVLFLVLLAMVSMVLGMNEQRALMMDSNGTPRYVVAAKTAEAPAAVQQAKAPEPAVRMTALSEAPETMAVIFADCVKLGAVKTMDEAQLVLDSLIDYYRQAHPDESDVAFLQQTTVMKIADTHATSPEELYLTLRNAMEMSAQAAQPQSEEDEVDTAALAMAPICITSTRTETVTEVMPYETEYIEDGAMTRGAQNVDTDGIDGERIVTYQYTLVNGVQTQALELEVTVTTEPVNLVMRKGTKPPYARPGNDGTVPDFIYPSSGRISSYYGMRRDRMHYGLDIVAPVGTPLKASLGGVVTFAGERGDYGLLVEIDHGNGFVTRYAHCSKILVSVGQQVAQGEVVAGMGETGNAACPHIHFEIRLNGIAQDPLPYLD